ncbi:MAG: hypothetical protein HON90_06480, partial [Halobacteriovoraceae bacterium]|nr:hypothetical protein [Halobacteriovoraceae bacterium]
MVRSGICVNAIEFLELNWHNQWMRNSIILYINNELHEIDAKNSMLSVANYLRYKVNLTGTKIVCSEGDCGACTVILARFNGDRLGSYQTINSCISFIYLLDKCHIITVEGLSTNK